MLPLPGADCVKSFGSSVGISRRQGAQLVRQRHPMIHEHEHRDPNRNKQPGDLSPTLGLTGKHRTNPIRPILLPTSSRPALHHPAKANDDNLRPTRSLSRRLRSLLQNPLRLAQASLRLVREFGWVQKGGIEIRRFACVRTLFLSSLSCVESLLILFFLVRSG